MLSVLRDPQKQGTVSLWNGNKWPRMADNHVMIYLFVFLELQLCFALSPVTLTTPTNNAINLTSPFTFTWQKESGALSYKIQLCKDKNYGGTSGVPVTDQGLNLPQPTTSTVTWTANATKLTCYTSYYWRVIAYPTSTNDDNQTTKSFSADWYFSTAACAPGVPANPSSSNITMNSARIQWNASAGATNYEYRYGTTSSLSTTYQTGGLCYADLADLSANTKYYWDVRATNEQGPSIFCTPQPTFTTAAVIIPSPPTLSHSGPRSSKTLSWSTPTGAVTYQYRIQPYAGTMYSQRVLEQKGTSVIFVGLAPTTTYRWQVRAANSSNTYGNWSSEANFTTEGLTSPTVYDGVLAGRYATTYTDADNTTKGSKYNPIYLSYHTDNGNPPFTPPDPGACTWYQQGTDYCGGDCTNFLSQCLKAGGLVLTTGTVDGNAIRLDDRGRGVIVAAKELYWWLWGIYNVNRRSATYFDSKSTTSFPLPSNFTLAVGDVIQFGDASETNSWLHHSTIVTEVTNPTSPDGIRITCHNSERNNVPLSTIYGLEADGKLPFAYFHHIPPTSGTGLGDRVDLTGPGIITTYPGNTQTWTATFVDQATPVDNVSNWDLNLMFNYEGGYHTLATATKKANTSKNKYLWTITVGNLPLGKNWLRDANERICGTITATGFSGSSSNWIIEGSNSQGVYYSGPARPVAPTLSAPANNADEISLTPSFSWNAVSGAKTYNMQITTDNEFTTLNYNFTGRTGLNQIVYNLLPNTTYYWRVTATNDWGTSKNSAVRTFKTQVIPTDVLIENATITAAKPIPIIQAHNSITIQQSTVKSGGIGDFRAGNFIIIKGNITFDNSAVNLQIDPTLR